MRDERVAVDPAVPCGACELCAAGLEHLCPAVRFAGHGATDGALRTLLPWPERLLHPVPETLTDIEAALAEPLGVALHAFDLGHVRPGAGAGVFGCGPLGLLLVQLLHMAGASPIVATDLLAHRVAAAEQLGATHAVLAGELELDEGLEVAFEVAGDDGAVDDAVASLRPGGRLVLVGIPDDDRTSFRASAARRKGLTLLLTRRMRAADLPRALRLAAERRVDLAPPRQRPVRPRRVVGRLRSVARAPRPEGRDRAVSGRYALGIDFGTESGRAVLVDVADGREVATAVSKYTHGVITERLPAPHGHVELEPEWALQDPADYVRTLKHAVPEVLGGIRPEEVVGVGIDFTSCTMLPTTADGTPLCELPDLRLRPHAWVKLWKHHAAQPEADEVNAVAMGRGEPWLSRYGGKISSEWFFPKALQILRDDPEVYARAGRLIEAADWIVWQLTGVETRNTTTAGYKAIWSKSRRVPVAGLLRGARPALRERRGREDVAPHPRHRRARRWPRRARGGMDGTAPRHAGGGRERRRARLRSGRRLRRPG